mgnify:CR=1 FL=1
MTEILKFIEKYKHPKNIRYESFYKALSIAYKRNHKIIVETGTSRGKKKFFFFSKFNWKDGMSTLIFAEFASHVKGKLYSCDLLKKNIDMAKNFTKLFNKKIIFVESDSVKFLENINFKIDFLYLDSFDGHNPELASKHQLNEIQVAIKKLHDNSLVLLDDKTSKSNLSLDFMLKNNFKILNESGNQILLSFKV